MENKSFRPPSRAVAAFGLQGAVLRLGPWSLSLDPASWLLPPGFFLLLALFFLWPLVLHPGFIPFPPTAQFSDLLITHLPNAEYLRDSLGRYQQWPLWNAQIFAGQPF